MQEHLQEVQTILEQGENPRAEIDYLLSITPSLVEENVPVIGDGVEKVSYFLLLEQAKQDVEEFDSWLNTLEVENPISNAELEEILGE